MRVASLVFAASQCSERTVVAMYPWRRMSNKRRNSAIEAAATPAAAAVSAVAPPSLLSDQQFREHARELANVHTVLKAECDEDLKRILDDNESAIERGHRAAQTAIAQQRKVEPAVEWLV